MTKNQDRLIEYQKTLDLFMNESRLAWQLVSIWIALQIGIGSATALLHSRGVEWGTFSFIIISICGCVSCAAWWFIFYRNYMWRDNWLRYGLRIERELKENGINFNIFEFENRVRDKKITLDLINNEIKDRPQRWREKIGALRVAHWGMGTIAIIWFGFLLINLKIISPIVIIPDTRTSVVQITIQNYTIQNYTLQNIFLVSYSILYGIMLNTCMGLGLFYFGWIRWHMKNKPLKRLVFSIFFINIIPFAFFSFTYNWFSTAQGQNPLQIFGVFLMSLFVFAPYRFYHFIIIKRRAKLYGYEIWDTGVEKRLEAIGPYPWNQIVATVFYLLLTFLGALMIKGPTAFSDLITFLSRIVS